MTRDDIYVIVKSVCQLLAISYMRKKDTRRAITQIAKEVNYFLVSNSSSGYVVLSPVRLM